MQLQNTYVHFVECHMALAVHRRRHIGAAAAGRSIRDALALGAGLTDAAARVRGLVVVLRRLAQRIVAGAAVAAVVRWLGELGAR